MLIKGELRFIKMLKTLKVYDNQHNLVLLNQEALQEIEEQKRISAKHYNKWTPDKADPVVDFKDNRWPTSRPI